MYKIDKRSLLLRSGKALFHTQDLAVLWQIANRNTLYTTIKRYLKNEILIPVTKGLYSTLPLSQINKYALGAAISHRFCYVSCETVLSETGVINQEIIPITFVSSVSLRIELNGTEYIFRKMKPEILLDMNGVEKKDGYFIATRERAISDMIYFNPKYYFDNEQR